MIPRTPSHEKLTRWMNAADPILATRMEGLEREGIPYEVETATQGCMLYAHELDGSCCAITNRNQGTSAYTRSPQGGFIRGE
jgi:hypothetical protein